MDPDRRPDFFLLTGFLGSGKTTLLGDFLRRPEGKGTAVLVNELGDVALDHLLLETLETDVSLLPPGCVCCVVGGELEGAIERALEHRPRRIVLETTGLADPAPVLHALATSRVLRAVSFAGVVTVLDASRGAEVVDAQLEGRLQLDMADRVVLTKLDLASPEPLEGLRATLAQEHPSAEVVEGPDASVHAFAPVSGEGARVRAWLSSRATASAHDARTRVIELPSPSDADALQRWLGMVTMLDGPSLLRIKGIAQTASGYVVLQSAQRALSPPRLLSDTPRGWTGSRLVVISRGLDERSLDRLADTAQEAALGRRRRV